MSVPAQQMMPGGAPPSPGPDSPPGGGAPAAAPMMSPAMPAGQQEGSRVDVMMATKLLERCIPAFGIGTKEGKSILSALKALGSAFGESEQKTQELMPAELRHMIAAAAGPGMPGAPQGAGAAPQGPPQGAGAGA